MVKVLTDSTADLSGELLERYDIEVIPLHVHLGDKEYRDGVDISQKEIYAWADANKTTPKTSAPSVTDVADAYNRYPDREIITFCISETMSTSGNVMRIAAEETGRENQIYVIDSKNLSTGIGLLVIEAAIMAADGKSAKEIVDFINELIPKVRASFVVDTLTYLHRGGRCSGVAAFAGTALKLHPQINVADGNMLPGKKYRGNLKKAVLQYAEEKREELLKARPDRVFITHAGSDDDVTQAVYDYLKSLNYFKEIHITCAGGVVSSHCGYGTLGVLYILN